MGAAEPDRVFISGGGTWRFTDAEAERLNPDPVTIPLTSIEEVESAGGPGPDRMDASNYGGGVALKGNAGKDRLRGSSHEDLLIGGDGDDVLPAGAGKTRSWPAEETICCGARLDETSCAAAVAGTVVVEAPTAMRHSSAR